MSQAMFADSEKIGSNTAILQLRHTLIDDNNCRKVGRSLVHSQGNRRLSETLSHNRHWDSSRNCHKCNADLS